MLKYCRYLLCVIFVVGNCMAQTKAAKISFATSAEVPVDGLRMMTIQGAQPVGLAPPAVYTLRDTQGTIFEAQLPRDLWYGTQYRGCWEDAESNKMTVAAVTVLMPRTWPRQYVKPQEYAEAVAKAGPPDAPGEWKAWVEDFAGSRIKEGYTELQATTRLNRIRLFRFAETQPVRVGIAFTFRPNPFRIDPDQWFFVLFELQKSMDPAGLDQDQLRTFLASINPSTRSKVKDEKPSERFQAGGASEPDKRSDAFAASRQRAIESIRGRKNWWFVETPNYVLVSDLPAAHASLVRQIQGDVETLRPVFVGFIPPIAPIEAVSVIRIFAESDEYGQYVGSDMEWTGGSWIPSRGELAVRPLASGRGREQQEWVLQVAYHEAFHQYLHYALHGHRTGAWFNEGHAVFFEGASIRGDQVRFGEAPRYVKEFDQLVKSDKLEFSRLLQLSYSDFYAGGSENYARAWGLIYYLRKHAAQNPDHYHAGLAARYVEALIRTRNEEQAVATALEGSSVEELEKELKAFWNSPNARSAARRFDPLMASATLTSSPLPDGEGDRVASNNCFLVFYSSFSIIRS